ncbi:MAG: serine/threonine-protein kinase [Pirellulales bacterium]
MDPQSRETLADLLLAWEDAFRAGHDLSAAELAREQPALIEALERRIRVLKATFWIDHPQECSEGASEPPPPSGRLLGSRYRLDERIAVGGFAEVWRAFDTELQRTVAVKIPKAARIAMKDAFLAEARRVARLRHPGIVSVHDVGTDGEECFIVSEFMDGGSLANPLARGPIDQPQTIRWLGQIADALDFAHREGVIHRDVKPANILLNHHGDAVLADFGIAQSATKSGEFAPSVGTLRYMAPEQFTGGSITAAGDIYSLGIVLHEALTGATPHSSDAAPAIRTEVTSNRDLRLASSLPPGLAAVCRRAIDRDPTRRHETAAAFASDLRSAAGPATPRGFGRRSALAVAAAILAVTAGLTLASRQPEPAPSPARPERAARASTVLVPVAPAAKPARLLGSEHDRQAIELRFPRIEASLPYVVSARGVGLYREWQEVPDTYVGPLANDTECSITFRFDFALPLVEARLIAVSQCWDFTPEPGGMGRGAAAVDVSQDGIEWITIRDTIAGLAWGDDWSIDEPLPAAVLGGRSLWVRARLLTNGSPNTGYSVAQFGRNRADPSQPTFGIVAEFARPE